ncbi:tape measure protein [Photobacterium japonica]|uniref:tape measure protein n=1 Tax=Photobacterium japonica TaxID=2910235 RepID=UPI003D0CD93D
MSNNLKFTLKFDAETRQFVGEVRGARQAVDALGDQSETTRRQMRNMASQSDAMQGQLMGLKSMLLGVAAGFSAVAAAQKATERLGAYQDIRNQITSLVGGQQEWLKTEQYLIEISKEHNKALLGMAGSYARVASIEDAGMITRQQTIAIFEGMSDAAASFGATNDQLGQSMFGLQQAMSSQIVRAEELNQTMEPLPGLLTRMDRAASLPAGGFRQMVNAGKVTSAFFAETLVKALATYEGAAASTAGNINAMYGDLSTAYTQAVVAFEQPISDAFSPLVLSLTESLNVLADNAALVSTAVGVTLALALGRGTAVIVNMTAAKIADSAATIRSAQSNVSLANAEVALLTIQKQALTTTIARIKSEQIRDTVRKRLTVTTNTLIAAEGRLATATIALSHAQSIARRTGAALNATMGFLGGPAGIAMMAVSALGYFALSNQTAAAETDNLSDRIDHLLGRMDVLQIKQVENALADLKAQQGVITAQMKSLSAHKGTHDIEERLAKLDALRVKEKAYLDDQYALEDKLHELKNKQDKQNEKITPKPLTDDKVKNQAEQQLAMMQRQVALFGETSEAAKLRYDIEHGALKGINEELAKKLLLEAKKLDSLQGKAASPIDSSAIDAFYLESDELNTAWLMRLAMQAEMENQAQIQEQYAYNERLQQLSASFQAAYAQAQDNNQLQDELEREYFANREILRADHEANLTDIERKAGDERQAYQNQVAQSTLNFTQQQLSLTTNFLKQAGEEQGGLYRVLFAAQKLAAIPSMVVATEEAATKALSFGPPPVGMALSAAVRTMGYASVGIVAGQALAGQAHDGIDRVPAQNEGTWMLRKDEMVLNPKQADNFRWMVSMMQQMKAMQSQQHLQMQQQSMGVGGNPNINVAAPAVHVAFLDNQEQLKAYLRSDAGEQAVVKIVQRNRANLN